VDFFASTTELRRARLSIGTIRGHTARCSTISRAGRLRSSDGLEGRFADSTTAPNGSHNDSRSDAASATVTTTAVSGG
jgi:hypothetical protein